MTRVKGGRVSWIEPARENDSDTEDGICHQGLRGVARKRKSGKGRQRCLQLDLRGVAEDQAEEGKEVYHMGMWIPSRPAHSCSSPQTSLA